MKSVLQFIGLICLGLLLMVSQSYANEPVSTGYWDNTAIGGHDSLEYYEQGI